MIKAKKKYCLEDSSYSIYAKFNVYCITMFALFVIINGNMYNEQARCSERLLPKNGERREGDV